MKPKVIFENNGAMTRRRTRAELPPIPAKRYFTIGDVSELCRVKPHVLHYWEQRFAHLTPVKRGGNRRYYQHHEVLLIRRIRELLYEEGFTIRGARNQLNGSFGKDKVESAIADNPENSVDLTHNYARRPRTSPVPAGVKGVIFPWISEDGSNWK